MKYTHWNYTVHLTTCNLSERQRTVRNPFTGELMHFPIDDGLNAEECHSLSKLVQDNGFVYSDIPGEGYELKLPNDEQLRMRGEIKIGYPGFSVEIRVVESLNDYILDLVLAWARAGNCCLTSFTGKDARLTQEPTSQLMKDRWPNAPLIRNS